MPNWVMLQIRHLLLRIKSVEFVRLFAMPPPPLLHGLLWASNNKSRKLTLRLTPLASELACVDSDFGDDAARN